MPPRARDEIINWPRRRARAGFTSFALLLANTIVNPGKSVDVDAFWEWLRVQKVLPKALREKRRAASRQNRPKGQKGK